MTKPVIFYPTPEKCDVCEGKLVDVMYDAKTSYGGMWANMCETCFQCVGFGLGTGLGQKYERNEIGQFQKVAG